MRIGDNFGYIKSVFVTGATDGTGFAIASRFAREGYSVFIGSRTGEKSRIAAEKSQRPTAFSQKITRLRFLTKKTLKKFFSIYAKKGIYWTRWFLTPRIWVLGR